MEKASVINAWEMNIAAGKGPRFNPLTTVLKKTAVPFGGDCKVIYFVLSNFLNSELLKISADSVQIKFTEVAGGDIR